MRKLLALILILLGGFFIWGGFATYSGFVFMGLGFLMVGGGLMMLRWGRSPSAKVHSNEGGRST